MTKYFIILIKWDILNKGSIKKNYKPKKSYNKNSLYI